jgi:uncharacterized protein (TIGR02117 family)
MNRSFQKNVVLPVLLVFLVWLDNGCVGPVKGLFPVPAGQPARTIYVVHRGLHTGVVVKAADVPAWAWPQSLAFPKAEYIEVGWGDSQGYRFPLTPHSACRALFYSQGSVLLVHLFTNTVIAEYSGDSSEIIEVQLSPRGFDRMCDYIGATYALDASNRPIPMPTPHGGEEFFLAQGHYSMLNNCNDWTAGALREAGCPISSRWSVLPGIVMHETRGFGRVIWRSGAVK